ncbi:uncharacterized protein MAM_03689 [Metarhizium album ARSEF 1941]|uniref:Fucose-specific lectin n=1 Tax=Metarhizium album (strain ARSEF 1941) TaxID=1081103 RepID=A0A0B2X0E4_METAS|nr:uncharacterized protein MAM_03689 [Metarhizium album ARSEF 1941]KHN98565.1 hypothetical protein MAM_03689 [Metarhizium album ARSEF 1941]
MAPSPRKALSSLVGLAVAVQGAVTGRSYTPECGGLQRLIRVQHNLTANERVFRASAPYYTSKDSDQHVTRTTMDCLRARGITLVISLNSKASDEYLRNTLTQQGLVYLPLPVEDFGAPTLDQLALAWALFVKHRNGTLVWCGYGHGRTGTLITFLQMSVQDELGQKPRWGAKDYKRNSVEMTVQNALLDEVQFRLRRGLRNNINASIPSTSTALVELRVKNGDFDGIDCPQVLHDAWTQSSKSSRKYKRTLPGEECKRAREMLLRHECGVDDFSRPAATLYSPGKSLVLSRNGQGNLVVRSWNRDRWSEGWSNYGGSLAGDPAVMLISNGDLRIYARSADNHLLASGIYNGKWIDWGDLGGDIAGSPSAIWLGAAGIRVYARGREGQLLERRYQGNQWHEWKNLGGYIFGDPSAVWLGAGAGIRVYARNGQGQLIEKSYQGKDWHDWKNLGGQISSSPAAISSNAENIRVYARNHADELVELSYEKRRWLKNWRNLGGEITGSPGAVLLGDGVRVYARSATGNLLERGYWHNKWQDWKNLGRNDCDGQKSELREEL